MANKSDWKGFEKLVAEALGGKRRFRTTENYGKTADDVKFDKRTRREHPRVRKVAIECKKRKGTLNIHAFFAEAKTKYIKDGKHLIFASKITKRGTLAKDLEDFKERIGKLALARYLRRHPNRPGCFFRLRENKKLKEKLVKKALRKAKDKIAQRKKELQASHDISALVTVELKFFSKLWNAWIGRRHEGEEE